MNDAILTTVFVLTCVVGIGCSLWLWRRYSIVAPTLPGRDRLVLQALVVIAGLCTIAAGYFGILSVRRLVGLEPLGWTGLVSFIIAECVLLIPAYIVFIVRAVSEDR